MKEKRISTLFPLYIMAICVLLVGINTPGAIDILISWKQHPVVIRSINTISSYGMSTYDQTITLFTFAENTEVALGVNTDTTEFPLSGPQTLTIDQAYEILKSKNSPAANKKAIEEGIKQGEENNIDFAYAIAMFWQESQYATDPNYAYAVDRFNPGNIMCSGNVCQFDNWGDGFRNQVKLLSDYREINGITNIRDAIARWAPADDCGSWGCNDPHGYANSVEAMVKEWRQINKGTIVKTIPKKDTVKLQQTTADVKIGSENVISTDLNLDGFWYAGYKDCLRANVLDALERSPGLREVIIAPQTDWSFNENWRFGDTSMHVCAGIPYGGICDMAARYSNAARKLGLPTQIAQHTTAAGNDFLQIYGVDFEDSVGIWSSGGRGGGDLIIGNPTNKTVKMKAIVENDIFKVIAWFE